MPRQYRIYVVRLSEAARPRIAPPGKNPRLPCVYIGYTSKNPEERFAQHKAGRLLQVLQDGEAPQRLEDYFGEGGPWAGG